MKHKWFSILVSIAIALSLWGLMPISIAMAADSDIVISEVMFNSYCESANGTNTICEGGTIETQYEWVEIYNAGSAPVDIQNWQICDSGGCDTITSASTLIGPHQYWIIGANGAALATEMSTSGGNYGTYDGSHTLILGNSIGSNGLSNTADAVYLKTSSAGNVTDCVSWASPASTTCSSLTYVSGGTGSDSTLSSENDGQSITNIQGVWYYHNTNGNGAASPYSSNVASGGSPTAITLRQIDARPSELPLTAFIFAFSLLIAAGGLLALRRRKA